MTNGTDAAYDDAIRALVRTCYQAAYERLEDFTRAELTFARIEDQGVQIGFVYADDCGHARHDRQLEDAETLFDLQDRVEELHAAALDEGHGDFTRAVVTLLPETFNINFGFEPVDPGELVHESLHTRGWSGRKP